MTRRCLAVVCCGLSCLLVAGCLTVTKVARTQRVQVTTDAPGATLWREDSSGRKPLGPAPQIVETPYRYEGASFNYLWWMWPGLSAAAVMSGGTLWATVPPAGLTTTEAKSRKQTQEAAWSLMGIGGASLLAGVLFCAIEEALEGEHWEPSRDEVTFSASADGRLDAAERVTIPGDDAKVLLRLLPDPALPPAPTPAPAAVPAVPLEPGAIVAVFDVRDHTGTFDATTLEQLTQFLASQVTEVAHLRVVPREHLRQRLVQEKVGGYRECFDESCQIELGKAMAAQKSLATKILHIGQTCVITSTLYDLRAEAADRSASAEIGCTADDLVAGVKQVVRELAQ